MHLLILVSKFIDKLTVIVTMESYVLNLIMKKFACIFITVLVAGLFEILNSDVSKILP